MKKRRWLLVGLGIILVAVLVGAGFWWQADRKEYAAMVAKPEAVKRWQADPRPLQPESVVTEQLNRLYDIDNDQALAAKFNTVVIPGLRGAWSIKTKTGKAGFGTNWTPQGVAESDDDYYISAYDGDHKLNSVIFMVNRKTGQYRKTLILKSRAHVGGIAYDRDHQRLFYSDDSKKKGGGISYVSQDYIDGYQADKQQTPIQSTRIPWQLASRTSAITLYQNQLVIVKYGQNASNRSIVAVPLQPDGLPKPVTTEDLRVAYQDLKLTGSPAHQTQQALEALMKKGIINSFHAGWDRMQGIAVANDGLTLISQSNGDKQPGKIWLEIPDDKGWTHLDFKAPKGDAKVLPVPHSVEEVSYDKDQHLLAMVFESGAKQYREGGHFFNRPTFMDRLLILQTAAHEPQKK